MEETGGMETDYLFGWHGETFRLFDAVRVAVVVSCQLTGAKIVHAIVVLRVPIPRLRIDAVTRLLSSTLSTTITVGTGIGMLLHRKATQLTLEIVPTSLGATPMTKVRTTPHTDVQLVLIVHPPLRRLGTKRTLLQYHVGGGVSKV